MEIKKTKFKDLLIINKLSYKDNRGFFKEIINEKFLKKKFIFDYISLSKKKCFKRITYSNISTTRQAYNSFSRKNI